MRLRKLIPYALAICAAQIAAAQPLEVLGGYTIGKMKSDNYATHDTMNGWNTSIAGYPTSRLGIAVDMAGFYSTVQTTDGSLPAVTVRQYSFMAGPQLRLFRTRRFETSFRALIGGARWHTPEASEYAGSTAVSDGSYDQTTVAALVGSNFDINLSRKVALRFSPGMYITHYGHETQRNFRFSVGPVFRFGGGD